MRNSQKNVENPSGPLKKKTYLVKKKLEKTFTEDLKKLLPQEINKIDQIKYQKSRIRLKSFTRRWKLYRSRCKFWAKKDRKSIVRTDILKNKNRLMEEDYQMLDLFLVKLVFYQELMVLLYLLEEKHKQL